MNNIVHEISKLVIVIGILCIFPFQTGASEKMQSIIEKSTKVGLAHYQNQIKAIEASTKFVNPISYQKNRGILWGAKEDWRVGFFPGSLWYLYELTGDKNLLPFANEYTHSLSYIQFVTNNHDVGFMASCSFGNAYRLTKGELYKQWTIRTAQSLVTRFRPAAGVIQSWDVDKDWQSKRGWECPVIIDNMMNLELLFDATKFTGDSSYYKIAISHANKTMQEHFRPNGSCFHVVDYSLKDGKVRNKQTAQGYSDNSAWARGQSWAIYGYTTCFRYTKNKKYLDQALKTLDFVMKNKNMPNDLIPYWDFDAPKIPNEPRDASTASVIASALYELQQYVDAEKAKELLNYADKMMINLASSKYSAPVGTNGNFLLMHSVSSIPHNSEIDVALNYADYYYFEALKRRSDLLKNH